MRTRHTALQSSHMEQPRLEVSLIAPERHQLSDAQAMAIGQQDQRRVPVTVAANPLRRLDELLDLARSQVLSGPEITVWPATRRGDIPIYEYWTDRRDKVQVPATE